ncbi:MAG: hypothetical protein M3Q58_02535, partial [Bacteroidota bacterium]|nr:hypothetical protein [Bacteroidota bacterium]
MFKNPFSTDRAEHLGDKIFEYFADHENFQGLFKEKSLIIEGGRGSGKTMFYLYHTYLNKKKESESIGTDFHTFLNNLELIGLHFRAD